MTRINDFNAATLGLTPASSQLWAVWGGKDYSLTLEQLGYVLGHTGKVCQLYTTAGNRTDTNTEMVWTGVRTGDSAYFDSNSAGLGFIIPNDRISYVSLVAGYPSEGGVAGYTWMTFTKNQAIITDVGGSVNKITTGGTLQGEGRMLRSGPIAVNSGDTLNMKSEQTIQNEGSAVDELYISLIVEGYR